MIWEIDYFLRCPKCGGFLNRDDADDGIIDDACNFDDGINGVMGWWDEGIIEEEDNYDDYRFFLVLRQYYVDNQLTTCDYRRRFCEQEGKKAFVRFTEDCKCRLDEVQISCNICGTVFEESRETDGLIDFVHPAMEQE